MAEPTPREKAAMDNGTKLYNEVYEGLIKKLGRIAQVLVAVLYVLYKIYG